MSCSRSHCWSGSGGATLSNARAPTCVACSNFCSARATASEAFSTSSAKNAFSRTGLRSIDIGVFSLHPQQCDRRASPPRWPLRAVHRAVLSAHGGWTTSNRPRRVAASPAVARAGVVRLAPRLPALACPAGPVLESRRRGDLAEVPVVVAGADVEPERLEHPGVVGAIARRERRVVDAPVEHPDRRVAQPRLVVGGPPRLHQVVIGVAVVLV